MDPPAKSLLRQFVERLAWMLLFFFLVSATFCGGQFFALASHYAKQSEEGFSQLEEAIHPHEALVVLTGDADRIAQAMLLLKRRQSQFLLISGVREGIPLEDVINQQGDASVNIHRNWEKIVVENMSTSTIENAERSGALLLERKVKRAILITSDYHLARALAIYKEALPELELIPYAVPSQATGLLAGRQGVSWGALKKLVPESVKFLAYALGLYPSPVVRPGA